MENMYEKPQNKHSYNHKNNLINKSKIDLKVLIEKSNPDYADLNNKKDQITIVESDDFNRFCNQNLKLKTNIYGNALTVIYLCVSVISFMKFKSDFYGIVYLILAILNIFVFIFEHKINKCKTMSSFLFRFSYYFIFLCFLIVFYEFSYFLFGKEVDKDFDQVFNHFTICDLIDFVFCLLNYSMAFAFSVNSYFLLIIVKIVNILVFILVKSNKFSTDNALYFNYDKVNKTLFPSIANNTNIYNDNSIEISLNFDMIIDNNIFLYKKLICIAINSCLFILFCFTNRIINISLILKYKFEQLISFAITQEKNLCLSLNTKKIIFKNNEIIKNEFSFNSIDEAIKFNKNIGNESSKSLNQNRTMKFKNFVSENKIENNIEDKRDLINDSANKKLNYDSNANHNENNNQIENVFKVLNGVVEGENINISNIENRNGENGNIIKNEDVVVKIKEKQLSESIDAIINNPNNSLMKQMESLSFFNNFQRLKDDENIFGDSLENIKVKDNNELEIIRKDSHLNYNFSNNNNNINFNNAIHNNNNENLSLRVMPQSGVFDTENFNPKNNKKSNLFNDILDFLLKNFYYKDQKGNNKNSVSDFNFSKTNKIAFNSTTRKFFRKKNSNKQIKSISNPYCYFGTYLEKAEKNIQKPNDNNPFSKPNQKEIEASGKNFKLIKIFYKETHNKKTNFIQFYFVEVNLDSENLKNFCNRYLSLISDDTKTFNPNSNNWITQPKANMVLKSGDDFAYYSITPSNNLFKDNKQLESLFKEKLEKLKLKKTVFKKNLNFMKRMLCDFKAEFDYLSFGQEEARIKNIQSMISLQEDNLIKFNRLGLIISKKANLELNYFNLGKLVEFTSTYMNYIYMRVRKSDPNFNVPQAYLFRSNNVINSNNNNVEIEKSNTNNIIFGNIGEHFKKECFKDLFINIDLEIYKQILFNLVIELNYILKEYVGNENENSITQEIVFNNENEIRFDNNNHSTMRFSRFLEQAKIIKNENELDNNNNNNEDAARNVKNYLKFDINGNLNSDDNLIFIEISISTYAKSNFNSDFNKSSINKNLKINNSYFYENGSRTIGSNSVNNNNRLFVKKRFNRTNTGTVNLPQKFREEGMLPEFKRKLSIPRPYQITVIENGKSSFRPKFFQNRLYSRIDSFTSKASKDLPNEENGNIATSILNTANRKTESNNNLNINNNNNLNFNYNNNNFNYVDCEIIKNKIDTKFYQKLANILDCSLTITYDDMKNAVKLILKSKKFFKKSDINELDITLNSEKLKDFSPKTAQGGQTENFNNYHYQNYYKNQSDNKLTLNLNSVQCYNINEEEELYEDEKANEEILNEIKMKKFKFRIDDSINNQGLCLNGIDTYVDENNDNNHVNEIFKKDRKKMLCKFDNESEIKANFSNSEDCGEVNEFNENQENPEVAIKNILFEKERKVSLIPQVGKKLEQQLDFRRLLPQSKKFTEISSQSQLNYIINLMEAKSVNNNDNDINNNDLNLI